jgi:hypothetical protein
MGERRMFSKTIIDSDTFLDMPLSSQLLYFHLSMRADDDGFINNPKSIMRNVRCNDDDLKLLIAKKFIIPFESGVVVIKHWKIHNYIRADRYKETNCLEEKKFLQLNQGNEYVIGIPSDNQVATIPQPSDNQTGTQGKLGKVNLSKEVPYKFIVDKFNELCTSLPQILKLTDSRKRIVKSRWKELGDNKESFIEFFQRVEDSDFLSGRAKDWTASFDWIMKASNFPKILEGNYDNRYQESTPSFQSNEAIRKKYLPTV